MFDEEAQLVAENFAEREIDIFRERAFMGRLAALTGLVALYMLYVTWTQWGSHNVYLADVGVFSALASGPLHGNWLVTPLAPEAPGNYFGVHFSPFLLLLTPLYAILDHPMTLLSVLTLALAATAFPLGLFARDLLKSDALGYLVAGAWLTNHFVGSMHLANHPESLSMPGLAVMFLALERRRPVLYALAMLWVFLVKEDFALFVAVFGVSLLLEEKKRRWGFATIGAAVGWGILALIIMSASGRAWFEANGHTPTGRFASMGTTKLEIVGYMLTHPVEMARRIVDWPLLWLFASLAFLPLLDWRAVWVGLFGAAIFLVTDDALISELWYYYSYASIPFLFYSMVRGARVIVEWDGEKQTLRRWLLAPIFAALIIVQMLLATRTDGLRRLPFDVDRHHTLAREIAQSIPDNAAVAAQYDLYPQVPHRKVLLPLQRVEVLDNVDYVFVNTNGRAPDFPREEQQKVFPRLRPPEWELEVDLEGYLLFRKVR